MIERDECLLRKVAKEREREEDKESVRFWTYLCFIHNKEDVKNLFSLITQTSLLWLQFKSNGTPHLPLSCPVLSFSEGFVSALSFLCIVFLSEQFCSVKIPFVLCRHFQAQKPFY